jgi:hypothetical protein
MLGHDMIVGFAGSEGAIAFGESVGMWDILGAEKVEGRAARRRPGAVLEFNVGSKAVSVRSAVAEGDGYDIGEGLPD